MENSIVFFFTKFPIETEWKTEKFKNNFKSIEFLTSN